MYVRNFTHDLVPILLKRISSRQTVTVTFLFSWKRFLFYFCLWAEVTYRYRAGVTVYNNKLMGWGWNDDGRMITVGIAIAWWRLCLSYFDGMGMNEWMNELSFIFSPFPVLLILASQRLEQFITIWMDIDTTWTRWVSTDVTKTRGAPPSFVEWFILAWVSGKLTLPLSTKPSNNNRYVYIKTGIKLVISLGN